MPPPDDAPLAGLRLDQISTHVATLGDAERFVVRYGTAVRRYLAAVLRDPGAAEEVVQEILLALLDRGGAGAVWPGGGRFRDYLKTIARNAAVTFLRKQARHPGGELPDALADDRAAADADRAMASEWQACLLARVWRELDLRERRTPGNLCHTCLRVFTEMPDADSAAQARAASERAARPLSPEAFRKQVSRARRLMAELILLEVARGVVPPTPAAVEDELHELGLWGRVRDYLPDDWREQFFGRR